MNLEELTKDQLKTDLPDFGVGDTVRVHTRITEGDKERVQVFEGVILKKSKGSGIRGSFTVRRIASGVGVEKTFFLHSPNVLRIEVVRKGKVRRARLYYLRKSKSKTIKIKEKRTAQVAKSQKTKKDKIVEKVANEAEKSTTAEPENAEQPVEKKTRKTSKKKKEE